MSYFSVALFPHQCQYNSQYQPEWYRDYQGQGQSAKHTQLPEEGMPLQCPLHNYLQLLHLEWLGNEIIGPLFNGLDRRLDGGTR